MERKFFSDLQIWLEHFESPTTFDNDLCATAFVY